jgi:hypothetical protein
VYHAAFSFITSASAIAMVVTGASAPHVPPLPDEQ